MTAKEKKEYIAERKLAGCSLCGFTGIPAQFDFHHRYPELKSYEVATCPPGQIAEEIDKCVLLCANCHRVLHVRLPKE